jgi:chemotaxis protein histidine kinase CheA
MGSMADQDIDALYQVPPGEFTAARNALAKARGADGADIKTLEKPTLPAWAVNQVYWHDRATFDALVKASTAMRHAHVQVISGRNADVASAEQAHNAAIKAALQSARAQIEKAGEKATPATIDAITETLQAFPTDDTPGRLTKPLKPMGFGALMGMGIPVVQGSKGPKVQGSASVASPTGLAHRSLGEGGSKGPSKKEIAEQAAARKAAAKALKAAEDVEEKADAALAEAKKAAAQVERELARVRDRLQFLEKQRNDSEELVRQRARELQTASNSRIQAAQDLKQIED